MHYRVIYLSVGERQTAHVQAPNAATAVAMAERVASDAFELLSVMPEDSAAAEELSRHTSSRAA